MEVRLADLEYLVVEPHRSRVADLKGFVDGDWDLHVEPIRTSWKVNRAIDHWTNGTPWEETGLFDLLMEIIEREGSCDNCGSLADIHRRYERLDTLFETVKADGRLKPRQELETEGVYKPKSIRVHINRHGKPVWVRDGTHRIAMAIALDFPTIPVEVLAIHLRAVEVLGEEERREGRGRL